jgi:ribonuclease D
VLKVFHACRQDMEIFYHLSGVLPTLIYDTQVAAQFAGFGESISYSEFIRKTLDISIDKASRFTDWARRPLSDKQLTYALDDVIHLREAYIALNKKLEKTGRAAWVQEEMAGLSDIALYKPEPDTAWLRLKAGNMKPKQLAALRGVARWREQEAMKRDLPRGRIVRDETLLEIAAAMPDSAEELRHIRGTTQIRPHEADALLAALEEARRSPPETWPRPSYRNRLDVPEDALALLQMLLAVQCHQHGILPRLVATRDDMEALINGETDLPCLRDWRYEIFGVQAKKLLSGKLRLAYDPAKKEAVLL